MTIRKKLLYLAMSAIFLMLAVSGCASFFQNKQNQTIMTGAAIGAVAGAGVGAVTGNVALLAGTGAIVGGAIGAYVSHEPTLLDTSQQQPIRYIRTGDNVKIIIPTDRVFEDNGYRIYASEYSALNNIADVVKQSNASTIHVTGYSDDIPPEYISDALSKARAESIASYLWAKGLDPKTFSVSGAGETGAIASSTIAGRQMNRRVEITYRENS